MSNSDIFISKGKCYSAKGEELDDSFIPCGNDDFGHVACCGRGDTCLTNNSCFGIHGSGYGSYLTYMAGCTDSDYKDSSCPNKDIGQSPCRGPPAIRGENETDRSLLVMAKTNLGLHSRAATTTKTNGPFALRKEILQL